MDTSSTIAHRILTTIDSAGGDTGRILPRLAALHLCEPTTLRAALTPLLPGRVVLTDILERRLLLLEHADHRTWTVAELSGSPLAERDWPTWARDGIDLADEASWCTTATLTEAARHRFLRPAVLLAALYHPENFPLPRFPLAISDLARAARATLTGSVSLMDMQLGVSMEDILTCIDTQSPDILGISATFGQHDLLTWFLDHLDTHPARPLVLAGGSLTARNEHLLLERWPWLLIARGAGEPTLADTIAHWHNDIGRDEIRGIGYTGAARGEGTLAIGRYRKTATAANRTRTDIFPELDLLATTFEHHGVAQLETSRGCTNYCSFCPRGHKGSWSGITPTQLPTIASAVAEVFDRYPHLARTLYLVDEEFIGRGPDATDRALAVADILHRHRFTWESSCRIDQVVRTDTDRDWHTDRARMWRTLRERGLRRMLFGVESGVTSILNRFNKETTSEQNALAIRTLSALGIPTRYTYITFDQLMTEHELRATHAFQARTDLILRPLPELPIEEIVDGVRDEAFVAEHTTGRPFYTGISYMLVSMECLIGAAYTKKIQAAGLAGPAQPAMGRLDASFADARIGVLSHYAQLWVDRTFALDYTLKSLEKISTGTAQHDLRRTRITIKAAAFTLLGDMLDLLDQHTNPQDIADVILAVMGTRLLELRHQLADTIDQLASVLPADDYRFLATEFDRWAHRSGWTLINAPAPC